MTARPCPYDDPYCTGKHGNSALKAELCPSAYAYMLERSRGRYSATGKSDTSREHHRNRQRAFTQLTGRIKVDRGCVDCGYNANPVALDFDHRPGVEKVKGVSLMSGYRWESVLAEIAKCDVRCANCHRIITAERRKDDAA